jgi:hypothetical protein
MRNRHPEKRSDDAIALDGAQDCFASGSQWYTERRVNLKRS